MRPGTRILMLATDRRLDRRIVFSAETLAAAGARVTIVARDPDPGGAAGNRLPAGVETVQYNTISGRAFPLRRQAVSLWRVFAARLPGDLPFAPHTAALLSAAAGRSADIVHAHDLDTLPAALRLARGRGLPLVYDAHEFLSASVRRRLGDERLAARLLDAERRLSSAATARIAVTAPLAALMTSRMRAGAPFRAVENVPPAADPGDFAAGRRLFSEIVGGSIGDGPGPRRFVDSGSVERFRNPRALLRAARHLRPGAELWMTRMGPDAAEFERKAAREGVAALRFFDPVPPRLLAGFLAGFSAGIVAIRGIDGYYARMGPNRLYDYLAAGIPVVGDSSLLAVREAIAAGAGIAVDMDDPAAIAAALSRFPCGEAGSPLRAAVATHEETLRERSRRALLGVYGRIG